jgi:hypothetical protein
VAAEATGLPWMVDLIATGHTVSRPTVRVATAQCKALRLSRVND